MSIGSYAASLRDPDPAVTRPRLRYREVMEALAALDEAPQVSATLGGESARGEPIWRIEIASEVAHPVANVFVVAGLHAMEHAGVAAALELVRRAAAADSVWARHRLVCVPLANPDGFREVERDLAKGRRRFRRKNARGVDLNRNFAASYRQHDYLNRLMPGVFGAGEGPLSEPEAQAVDAAVASCQPRYAVSLHTFGDWIFLPYASERRRPPDYPDLVRIARGMARRQPGRGYRVAQVGRLAPVFAARGAEIDHFYMTYGALSFLLEIGAGPSPRRPGSWLRPYDWYNASGERFDRDVARAVGAIEYLAELD